MNMYTYISKVCLNDFFILFLSFIGVTNIVLCVSPSVYIINQNFILTISYKSEINTHVCIYFITTHH